MRRVVIGLAFLAAWAGPSFAQQKPDSALSDDEKVTKSVADAVDRQYKATLERTRKEAKETRVDPWSNMRSSDTSKPKR
jgi:hypothetical protein